MPDHDFHKLPRLFVPQDLGAGEAAALAEAQTHHLLHVLRRKEGDAIRVFNGRDGEWLALLRVEGKKNLVAIARERIREQSPAGLSIHLLFAPIKKARMEWLVEKAVELGATHFHPVFTERTENRHLNETRIGQQIIEAAEQCERMDIPKFLSSESLQKKLQAWPREQIIYACIERREAPLLPQAEGDAAFLIGPEGGFSEEEGAYLMSLPFIRAVSLGPRILRAETAALFCLSHLTAAN